MRCLYISTSNNRRFNMHFYIVLALEEICEGELSDVYSR